MGNLEWQSFEVPVIVADQNDNVVILGREVFTIRKTGKQVDNTFLTLFKMRDGLIAEFTLCENTELVAAAFSGT
jgi:ketosteroid isomerase-like protein